jgi:hypothetical protein
VKTAILREFSPGEFYVANKSNRFAFSGIVAAALLFSPGPASSADFPTVVRSILDRQTDGPLSEMEPDRRTKMTACVVDTLGDLPSGLQRKIVDAGDIEAQEHAFGQVVDADHAKWRQTIAKTCGHIATAAS